MSVQFRAPRVTSIYLPWLLIACCLAAQPGSPPKPQDSKTKEEQLHAGLERAAEAMHKGELADAAKALRQALTIDPHSLAALNNLGIVLSPGAEHPKNDSSRHKH